MFHRGRQPRRWQRDGHPFFFPAHYVRARLHRRLFFWFAAAILITGLTVFTVSTLTYHSEGPSWSTELSRMQTFASGQFARVWDDAAQRDALASALSRDLDVDVVLASADGHLLSGFGKPCEKPPYRIPVKQEGTLVGTVGFCADRHRGTRSGPGLALPVFAAMGVLWAAAGRLARRLSRPLTDLSRVAQELGTGRLSSRYTLRGREYGEVRVLAGAFNDMAARIEKQIRDQRELLAAVSHELRTPLGHIRLLVELAREGGADPKALDELDREVVEMDALVGQLLAHARLDFATLTFSPLDGAELARRALERAGLPEAKLRVEVTATAFEGDATLVARALANLVDNAQKHGKGLSALKVSGREGVVSFEAEDQGEGFAPGDEERAFDAFYRKSRGTERDTSLGLGLALVKRTAEAHGGKAWAKNREGGGASVGFELPVASETRTP